MSDREKSEHEPHTRAGGSGKPVPADDPRDDSVEELEPSERAQRATPPTEGPAAAGSLPG